MIKFEINALSTRALVDKEFGTGLLNGQRHELLQEFKLSENVVDAIMGIQEDTLKQFIFQLNVLVNSHSDGLHLN